MSTVRLAHSRSFGCFEPSRAGRRRARGKSGDGATPAPRLRERTAPSDDFLEGGPLGSDAGLSNLLAQAGHVGLHNRRGRAEVSGHPEDDWGFEDVRDALRVSRHERLEMLEHLLLNGDSLPHQVAPVPGQQLELDIDRVGIVFRQAKAIDGGAMDRGEVRIIGFIAGIGGEAILLGGVGMDDADLEPRLAEGAGPARDNVPYAR